VSDPESSPLLRVVSGGEPTEEETAALLAAILAVTSAGGAGRETASAWADRGAALRRPLRPGPGAWRRSARPSGAALP